MRIRLLVRRLLTWFFAAVVLVIPVSVVGEWFIHVADDKGWYKNAGQHWDNAVSAVLDFVTSPAPLTGIAFLGGLVAGVWLDAWLLKRERTVGETPKVQTEASTATSPPDGTAAQPTRAAIDHSSIPPKERSAVLGMLREVDNFLTGPLAAHDTSARRLQSLKESYSAVGFEPTLAMFQEIGAVTDSTARELKLLITKHQSDLEIYDLPLDPIVADLNQFRGRTQEVISRCRRAGDVGAEAVSLAASQPMGEAFEALNAAQLKTNQARLTIKELRMKLL